jgi:hypothetical protein
MKFLHTSPVLNGTPPTIGDNKIWVPQPLFSFYWLSLWALAGQHGRCTNREADQLHGVGEEVWCGFFAGLGYLWNY